MKRVLWSRSLPRPAHRSVGLLSLFTANPVASLILFGCATAESQRFPLTYVAGQRIARYPATARDALQECRRMGADLELQGQFVHGEIACRWGAWQLTGEPR